MHKHDFDIELKNLSKLEGHTDLDVKVKKGKVVDCKLKIDNGKRFITDAVVGMKYSEVPAIVSRICGTCSSAHALCSNEAIEKAFGVKVSNQTRRLKNLLINANHLRDHAMHLYFFVLPDVFGKESVLDFGKKYHDWIHYGLEVKDAGNYLSTIIGGRAVHPSNAVIGGFTKFPTQKEILEAKKKLTESRDKVLKLIDLLFKNRKVFRRKTNYVGLVNKDYNFLEGKIKTGLGSVIEERDFGLHLERVILPYSSADSFEFESKEFFVGALARLNINRNSLNPKTKKDCSKYLKIFPSVSMFDNNLSQAIEMLHIIDNSLDLLSKPIKKENLAKIIPKKSTGVGVIEAPRGTLYHRIDINEKGIVTFVDLCIPTQQNIIHMQNSIARYVEELLKANKSKKQISREIEEMIRSYDPCMACATNFLKMNWV